MALFVGFFFLCLYYCAYHKIEKKGDQLNANNLANESTPPKLDNNETTRIEVPNEELKDQGKSDDASDVLGSEHSIALDMTAGVSEKDKDELNEYITANDEEGFALKIAEKVSDGTAFRLQKGVRVKIINVSFFYVKVRVLDGEHQNKTGYLDTELVLKN